MFQGVSIKEFSKAFSSNDGCKQYLFDLKWTNGYKCRKCENDKAVKGKTSFHRRCSACAYDESVTAHTVFHKLKFPLLEAFRICFRLSVRKKGMSCLELAREHSVNKKTGWLFKRKIQESMKSSELYPLQKEVHVDEFVVGGADEGEPGRSGGDKKLIVIGVEKVEANKIGRAYGRVIENSSSKEIKPFFETHLNKQTSKVITDGWRGYRPLKTEYNLEQILSAKGANFPELHIVIMSFKGWLRGIHHKCSKRFMQGYLDEFFFRFNRRSFTKSIFHKLIERMMKGKPYAYKAKET